MTSFALAHWSCGGAWAWGEVPSLLRGAGHAVAAPDFDLTAGQTPMDHAAALVAAAASLDDSVVVCGHSYGGLVALPAAEALGERASAVVVVDGLIPDDGDSGFSLRPERASLRRAQAAERGDGCWVAGPQSPTAWSHLLRPMPLSTMETPVALSGAVDSLPRTFLWCTRSDMGGQAARARERGWRVVALDAEHSLPIDDPATCAELLLEAGRSVRSPA